MSGEPGEATLTNACLLADCQASKGQFREAERLLCRAVKGILKMRDDFIRTTRIAIEIRLINVQVRLNLP